MRQTPKTSDESQIELIIYNIKIYIYNIEIIEGISAEQGDGGMLETAINPVASESPSTHENTSNYGKDLGRTMDITSVHTKSCPSNEEQESLDEYKECLADGEVGPGERRLLDKLASKLGISAERASELEASLAAPVLSDDEKEYLVFVRYAGKCYPAQAVIARNKLRITYVFTDTDDGNMMKKRSIIWSYIAKDNKLSFETAYLYAQYENRYDDNYYSTCPPTVMAVDRMLQEKYTLPDGGIPASDISGDLEEWTFTLADGSTVTKKVKVFR